MWEFRKIINTHVLLVLVDNYYCKLARDIQILSAHFGAVLKTKVK